MPTYAFVIGAARTGTTAMVYLLNAHSSVCIGIERLQVSLLMGEIYPAELFLKERFF